MLDEDEKLMLSKGPKYYEKNQDDIKSESLNTEQEKEYS